MMDKGKIISTNRHYEQIWNMAIQPVQEVVLSEANPEFQRRCSLQSQDAGAWKKQLLKQYRELREGLKEICYGSSADAGRLDGRKIAAVICEAVIRQKAFLFDASQAKEMMIEKRKTMTAVKFNLWLAQNVYLNYKLAYYSSLQLAYLTLLHDLQDPKTAREVYDLSEGDIIPVITALNETGHLFRYPSSPDADSFDVNMIIGMARADLMGYDFDMFFFAMQLYQLEMYTVGKLKPR